MRHTFLYYLSNIHVWFTATLLQIIHPVDQFVTKYIFEDMGFLRWLVIAMTLDLLTGVAKVWKTKGLKAVTSKGLRDTITKCIQYGAFLVITHVVTHYEIGGQAVNSMRWVNKLAMEFVLIIEVKSVYENIVIINPAFDFVNSLWGKVVKLFPVKETVKNVTSDQK